MGFITVETLLEENRDRLKLEIMSGEKGLKSQIISLELNRPGLALAGFVDLFTFKRIQLIGNTELLYLINLNKMERIAAFEIICQFDLPCIIFTNAKYPPIELIDICRERGIPLLVTQFPTTKFVHLLNYYLEDIFAPLAHIHGTLVDVYGIGLLFTGRPGIGKSEVSLDLVERGHRLVADDIVNIVRKSRGIIVGTAHDLTRSMIEIRGVGIVDVKKMFGVRATRHQKRIEIEVNIVDWDDSKALNRTGLDEEISTIHDVDIPRVEIPIYPGKYIAVIVESIALNHLLKLTGYNAAKDLEERQLNQIMENKKRPEQ